MPFGDYMTAMRGDNSNGMQTTRGGLTPQEEYLRWAWGQGTGASGGLGPLPLSVQGIGQATGRMFGPGAAANGFTPEFAAQVNQLLFPNVRPGFNVANPGALAPSTNMGANTSANLADMLSAQSAGFQKAATQADPWALLKMLGSKIY